jgi:hypothetical protein
MQYFDLNRRFVEREEYDADELIASEVRGKRLDWSKVLNSRFCVVVAPANFGKTTEMEHRASQMRASSKMAVFIALRALADRGSVEKALTVDELEAFKAWRASPTETLTLFVDSLDEAAAGKRESIEYLVRDLADAVSWPNDRVNWVLSTRPAVLTPTVFEKLSEILVRPASTIRETAASKSSTVANSNAATSTTDEIIELEKLRIFSMAPLESKQALLYLAGRHSNVDGAQLLSLAHERGLSGFTKNPGGLDILASIDMLSSPPDCLTEVFKRVVGAIQVLRASDRRLADAGVGTVELLGQAAQRLAAAGQVCQLVNIEMPPASLEIPQKALSARLIATPILNEEAIKQLLNSQLCIDVGFHQVKIYPNELSPFLAAQRLASLAESPEQALRLIQNFTWVAPSGEQGVQREFLPLMGWLATLNPHCRTVILQYEPQALAFFGDLRNNAIPLADAQEALTESIRRLVEQGDHPGRGMFSLTSENHWQAGPARLAPVIATLFAKYGKHYAARELLMDIAAASVSDILRMPVLRQSGNDYSRLLGDRAGVQYLLDVGTADDFKGLAAALVSSDTVEDSLAALLLRRLGWNHISAVQVSRIVNQQFVKDGSFFSIPYLFDSEEFLASATFEQLYKVGRNMVLRVARLSDRKQRRTRNGRRSTDQYVEMAVGVVAALVTRHDAQYTQKAARLCLVLQHALLESDFSSDAKELRATLESNTSVRRALLAQVAEQRRLDDTQLLYEVFGYRSACHYQQEDIDSIKNPRLASVSKHYQQRLAAAPASLPSKAQRRSGSDGLKVDAKSKKALKSRLAGITDASSKGDLAWVAGWLLQTNTDSRYGEVDFAVFRRAAGNEIADAAQAGLMRLWREEAPRYDEEGPRTTYNITAAGLQGLHLELQQGENLTQFSESEVRQALRYGTFEINGYPKWFWPLVATHATTAISELSKIAAETGNGTVSKEHAENLFTSLSDAPEPAREVLTPLAWDYLIKHKTSRDWVAEQILGTVLEKPATTLRTQFQRTAMRAMKHAFKSPIPAEPDAAQVALRSNAVMWAAHWLTSFPTSFQDAVNQWGPKDPFAVKAFIFALAAHFGRDRTGDVSQLAQRGDDGVMVLKDLYFWTMWAVNPAKDEPRPNGVVYSPSAKDNAQSFREALIPNIASATSNKAYEVLEHIRQSAPDSSTQMYIRRLQFELRERQLARKPIPQIKYDQFERDFRAEVTDSISFAMSVHSDLLALKYDIERGEHSLRSFFSEVDFTRISKPGALGAKAGIALEANFQRLLASELNHHAQGRYSISVESHTAESKRRDVLCSRNDWRASVELKMSERWTLGEYIEALESQLVGQYMRHRNATTGFLVLVLQTKGRRWTNPSTGSKIAFNNVLAILSREAQRLEGGDRSRYLRVIGIDATAPDDFRKRDEKAKTANANSTHRRPKASGSAPLPKKKVPARPPKKA